MRRRPELQTARSGNAGELPRRTENALSRIESSRRLTIIQLYKGLGGGWSLKDSGWVDLNGNKTR